jgi:hypothetical protein
MPPHANTSATATPPNDDDGDAEQEALTQAAHAAAGPGTRSCSPTPRDSLLKYIKWAAILAIAVGYVAWGAATHAAVTGGGAYLTDVIIGGGGDDNPHAVLKQQAAEAGVELTQEAMDKTRDAVRG